MKTSNINKLARIKDPEWQFLVEYPMSDFWSEHDTGSKLTTGVLFQTMRELGIPLEYIENIDISLTGFAEETLAHFKQGGLMSPGHIRVFFHRKIKDDANTAKTSRLAFAEQLNEHTPIEQQSGMIMKGGWGYFIIERSFGGADASERIHPLIDLYLYQEGE